MKLAAFCPLPLPDGLDLPEEVFIGNGMGTTLVEVVRRHLGDRSVLASAADCFPAASRELRELMDAGIVSTRQIFPARFHADEAAVAILLDDVREASGILAVGSGSVNDVAKMAAGRCGLPYVVLGTAASMNGYSSGVAAILSHGLKTTQPARPPRAILLDTSILREAPPELTRAGLGDLLSKPVSTADWWLAHRLDDTPFSEVPGRLVDEAVDSVARTAAGLSSGEETSLASLARALVLSGLSMVVAGNSSPASGGEHLVSHLWDMEALARQEPLSPHGAQVGVATIISAALYHHILRLDDPRFTPPRAWDEEMARIRREHGALSTSVLEPARRKHARAGSRVEKLRRIWPRLREELAVMSIPTPDDVRGPLSVAGGACRLSDLGLSRQEARSALLRARDIRDRVTVLDLAHELGVFPDRVDDVLDASDVT